MIKHLDTFVEPDATFKKIVGDFLEKEYKAKNYKSVGGEYDFRLDGEFSKFLWNLEHEKVQELLVKDMFGEIVKGYLKEKFNRE